MIGPTPAPSFNRAHKSTSSSPPAHPQRLLASQSQCIVEMQRRKQSLHPSWLGSVRNGWYFGLSGWTWCRDRQVCRNTTWLCTPKDHSAGSYTIIAFCQQAELRITIRQLGLLRSIGRSSRTNCLIVYDRRVEGTDRMELSHRDGIFSSKGTSLASIDCLKVSGYRSPS